MTNPFTNKDATGTYLFKWRLFKVLCIAHRYIVWYVCKRGRGFQRRRSNW